MFIQERNTGVNEKTVGKSHAGAPEGAAGEQKICWLDYGWSEDLLRRRDALKMVGELRGKRRCSGTRVRPGTNSGFTATAPRAP